MEISGERRAQELATLLLGVQEVNRPVSKSPGHPASVHDQVNISQEAKEIQRIKALVDAQAEVRQEKLAAIKQAIEAGTYQVGSRQVADALIRHVLTDSVL
jgi:negative regulator of flagellin synthesis FlgM